MDTWVIDAAVHPFIPLWGTLSDWLLAWNGWWRWCLILSPQEELLFKRCTKRRIRKVGESEEFLVPFHKILKSRSNAFKLAFLFSTYWLCNDFLITSSGPTSHPPTSTCRLIEKLYATVADNSLTNYWPGQERIRTELYDLFTFPILQTIPTHLHFLDGDDSWWWTTHIEWGYRKSMSGFNALEEDHHQNRIYQLVN